MYRSISGILFLFLFTLVFSGVYGQEAILSAGSDASGIGGSVSYSVGQAAYTHFNSQDGQVSLGAQQPYLEIKVGINDPLPTISVTMYPNPVKSIAIIDFPDSTGNSDLKGCSIELYDISGRLLFHQEIANQTTNVPM
jgi:hypothetical protein